MKGLSSIYDVQGLAEWLRNAIANDVDEPSRLGSWLRTDLTRDSDTITEFLQLYALEFNRYQSDLEGADLGLKEIGKRILGKLETVVDISKRRAELSKEAPGKRNIGTGDPMGSELPNKVEEFPNVELALRGGRTASCRFPALSKVGVSWFAAISTPSPEGESQCCRHPFCFNGKSDRLFNGAAEEAFKVAEKMVSGSGENDTPLTVMWWLEQEGAFGESAGGAFFNAFAGLLKPDGYQSDGRVVVASTVRLGTDDQPVFGKVDALDRKLDHFLEWNRQNAHEGREFDTLVLCQDQIGQAVDCLRSKSLPSLSSELELFTLMSAETGERVEVR